jgi:hypothetical protein
MGQIDEIKDKISNNEYLNISNQIQSLYKLKSSSEHKITFYVSSESLSDSDNESDGNDEESEGNQSENELEDESKLGNGSESKSNESGELEDDFGDSESEDELSDSDYEKMTEEEIIQRATMLREKVKLVDSELKQLNDIKDSLLKSDLEVKCECGINNIFSCFACPKICKNYDTICKLCPLFKIMIEDNKESKYSLQAKITHVENDENKALVNTMRYLFNYYKNIDGFDQFIGMIACVSVILNNYIPELNNFNFLTVTLKKIEQILNHYQNQKNKSLCDKKLSEYFDTTPEQSMQIVSMWKNLIEEKLSLVELMNIEY